MHASLAIIPTYNESENVAEIIHAVLALSEAFGLLVLDDNSPDGTAEIVRTLQQEADYADRLHPIAYPGKMGLGTAYLTGFEWALEHGYSRIFEVDYDFNYPLSALPYLLRAVSEEGYDVAIGSRYVRGGGVKNWPLNRILMGYLTSVYVRLVTWLPVQDMTTGFVCYRREVLEVVRLDEVHFKGYAFQIEMKCTAHCLGFKVREMPITSANRKLGSLKMNGSIFGETFTGVLKLRYWRLSKGFPKRRSPEK